MPFSARFTLRLLATTRCESSGRNARHRGVAVRTQFTGQFWDDAAGECVSVLLRHAMERMLDEIGNENLLCESGETCIYSPNIGAYQGHGNLIPHAAIGAGGTIGNVTLLRYEFNGR